MPDLPIPIQAQTLNELITQMTQLMDDLYQDRVGGALIGDVFEIGDDDILSLHLSSTGGIYKVSGELSLLAKSTGGIALDANGIYIKCKAGGGASTSADGLEVTGGTTIANDTIWDAAGDLVQGTGANTAAKLTKGAEGKLLRAGATSVAWSTSTLPDTFAKGELVVATAANVLGSLTVGLATQLMVGGGAATVPAWSTDIPTAVTIGSKYIYRADGTDIPVADGGTGASTFALNGVLYGNAANAIGVTAIGAEGQLLRVGASPFVPAWSTLTMPTTIAAGSVFAANSANILAAINSTTGTTYLKNVTGTIGWATAVTDTYVLYSDSGLYTGDADLLWDKTNNILQIGAGTLQNIEAGGLAENVTNRLSIIHGATATPTTNNSPTINSQRYDSSTSAGSMASNYFATKVVGGTSVARTTLYGYIESGTTTGLGGYIVGVTGQARVKANSDIQAFGLYGEGVLETTAGMAMGVELDCFNLSGTDAPAVTTSRGAGNTFGAQIVGNGTKKNSAGIAIISTGDSATCQFKTGIVFLPASYGSYGIDFLGMGAASATPIRLANNTAIAGRNAANNADINIIGLGTDNIVQLTTTTAITGNLTLTGTVDGIDIAGSINQAVLTTSDPSFAHLHLTDTGTALYMPNLTSIAMNNLSAMYASSTSLIIASGFAHTYIDIEGVQYVLTGVDVDGHVTATAA